MNASNDFSLRYMIYAGVLFVSVLYIFHNLISIDARKIICSTSVNQTKKERHFLEAAISDGCNVDKLLLQKCSQSEFVSLRARRRIAADSNAIFVHGDRVIELDSGYFISVDDILFGYDALFESDYLFGIGSWLGVQFQSNPNDAMVFQQLIWRIKPDLIIDLGTNVGGSAVFFASIMSFYSDTAIVLTIDRKSFTKNWLSDKARLCKDCVDPTDNKFWKKYVRFIQGSTDDPAVLAKVKQYVLNATRVFVSHDAAHDRNSVYQDLLNYAEFVSINSYMVVQDTKLDRLRRPPNGPLAAVRNFLDYQNTLTESSKFKFEVDRSAEAFYYSQHAYGWLKRIK